MASEIATLEAEVKEYKLQLDTVISGLQADPDNAELQELQTELEQVISLTEASIAELKPAAAPAEPASKKRGFNHNAPAEKWSRENHPAFKNSSPGGTSPYGAPDDPSSPSIAESGSANNANFSVNDNVLAKWYSGDRGFYPARITSITGSKTDPVYIVKFRNYDTTETLRAKDIRPLVNPNKRKADGTPVLAGTSAGPTILSGSSTPKSPTVGSSSAGNASSSVISAAANINPELAQQSKREYSKVSDGPPRPPKMPKKIKANKELEAGKNKWQDFAAKGKFGKAGKKDSMFRTPEGVNGRVGFTGSGVPMRKDATRSRHIYQTGGEEEF